MARPSNSGCSGSPRAPGSFRRHPRRLISIIAPAVGSIGGSQRGSRARQQQHRNRETRQRILSARNAPPVHASRAVPQRSRRPGTRNSAAKRLASRSTAGSPGPAVGVQEDVREFRAPRRIVSDRQAPLLEGEDHERPEGRSRPRKASHLHQSQPEGGATMIPLRSRIPTMSATGPSPRLQAGGVRAGPRLRGDVPLGDLGEGQPSASLTRCSSARDHFPPNARLGLGPGCDPASR